MTILNAPEVSTRDATIRPIVTATFPDYRRRTVKVVATETVTLRDLNWSGGTRAQYRACTLDGQPIGTADRFSALAPWANPAEGLTLPIPVGACVVEGGHFCGKVAMLRIYVNPVDMPRYLSGPLT